ncbi:hypothetical protein HOL24_03380 [bacterium]|nr:hypothetical protein [bacterium]
MLWEQSSQISPPHHINFNSIKGFEFLFQRAGFRDIQITTPGQLDVDIVKNFILNNPRPISCNRFIQTLIDHESTAKNFQKFLAENKLSSHAWILGKKD